MLKRVVMSQYGSITTEYVLYMYMYMCREKDTDRWMDGWMDG